MGANPHIPTNARSWRELVIRQVWAKGGGRHSMSQCMADGCKAAPEVECIWADGRGRAWHCEKHHDAWIKENEETEGQDDWMPLDIVKQRKVPNGVVGDKYGEYPEAKKARYEPFNADFIEKLRREFLLLMKNAKVVRNYAQAQAWRLAMARWRERFNNLIYDRLPVTIRDMPLQFQWVKRDEAKKWEQFVRKETWDLYIHSSVPIDRADDYWSEEARFHQFQKELKTWDGRVKRGARKAWKALNAFVSWYRNVTQSGDPGIDIPVDEQTRIEGFQVLVRGHERSDFDIEYMEKFKDSLRRYKKRAAAVLPLLLKSQLPLVLDFNKDLDTGGTYHRTYISINPKSSAKNPGRMVQILAHEMGHHIYQRYLSKEATDFWNSAVTGNYGDLDLKQVLSRFGDESSFYDNERIKREDPILYLQISGLFTMAEETFVPRSGKAIFTMDDLREYLDEGGKTVWRVHGKPITGYGHKNPEEAFCEALGMVVGYGPRAVLPEVRSWLKTILPQIKTSSRLDVDNLVAMYRQADAADGKTTGYRESVGLFIPLPKDLAEQFPSLAPTDNSPPHVTFLFIGHVPPEQDQLLLDTVHKVFSQGLPTIKAKLSGIDYFVHPDKDRRVAHCPVVFNRGMSEMRTRLRSALEDAGIEVGDSFPVYRPHVTLEYLPDTKSEYKGKVPQGSWEFDEIELWGLPQAHKVGFRKSAKAIPIDKSALRGVTKRLEKLLSQAFKVAMRTKANDPIRWREVWARDSHDIRNVMGQDLAVDLLVTAGKDRSGGPFVAAGGYGFNRRTNRPVVIVKLNGSYSAKEYLSAVDTGMLTKGIYNILIHEMTHAADAALKAQYEAGPASGPYTVDDEAAYYNDPKEVRAYMQQVVDEVLSFGGKRENLEKVFEVFKGPRDRGLEVVLKNTETWPEIKEHLTPANRNKILKAVYRALVDEGVIKAAGKQAFVAEDGWDSAGNHRVVLWPDTIDEEPIIHHTIRPAFEQAGYQANTVTRDMDNALGVEFLGDRLDPNQLVEAYLGKTRLAESRLDKIAGYYSVGDIVLYGKYKNKRGKVVETGRDEKGNPTITVEPIPKGKKKNKTLSVLKVWHENPEKRADIKDDPHAPTEFEELMQKEVGPSLEDSVTMLVAKYKDKHEDKDGNVHYEYSEKQVQHRDREKAKRIEGLKKAMPKLQAKVKKDLKSSDPKTKLTALAVALMDETYERVGNDSSADEGHFGVTGWQAGHVSFGGSTATIKYTGKSGVKHEKKISSPALVSALREAVGDKEKTTKILGYECEAGDTCVGAGDVNDYLDEFGITAKDIRGYHANDEMLTRLKSIRDKGPSLPRGRKDKDEILKKEFEKALAETATAVGHEPATLKSNYLVPGVHDSFMHDGTVMESFTKKGTKDQHEKEEESARGLVKKEPKKKPPRDDLRRRRVKDEEDDPDLEKPNATNDPDLSHNYKGRNARGGKKLTPVETDSFMGGTFYKMKVRDDRFVHFTPSSRALEIARSKKLLMNPPYKKFGIDAVAAVSLTYGQFVPGTQTTHIKGGDEELVGIIFTTNAIPDVGYVEEVLWKRDVPLSKVQIVPASRAISMLGSTPERIGSNDQVYYEGSPHLNRLADLADRAAALALRFITAADEPEWAKGRTFPHTTDKGEKTQVGWKSLTPEEQAQLQKKHDEQSEDEDGEEKDKADDEEPKGKGKKPKKDPGDPKLTPEMLSQDPGSAKILWQVAGGGEDGNIPSAKELADMFEHVKQVRITEETAQKILDMRAKHGDAATMGDAIEKAEKAAIQEILAKADIKAPALKKRLDGMDAEAKAKLRAAMEATEAEYMGKPVSSDVAARLADAHDGDVSEKDLPEDPAELGKYLAERAFTQNVVLNPLMAGGRAVNNDEKSADELQARAAASFDTYRDLEPEARKKAAGKVLERLDEVKPDSNEAKELNAILDGVALAGALSGESTPGRPPPSPLFIEVAKSLEQQGEVHTLLAAVDPNSTEGRDALRKGIEGMSDEAMADTIKGTPVFDAIGERLLSTEDKEAATMLRKFMADLATDDIQFVDPMIRDGLEAKGKGKGKKEKSKSPKARANIRKEIHDEALGALEIPENLDEETQKRLRMGLLSQAVSKVRAWLGSAKSMATTQVEKAIEADEPDILNVPAAKPVSRPVEEGGKSKKGVQSGAYTSVQLSEGPCPFEEWGMIEPKSPRSIRRNTMSKLLTKKGADQMMDHAGRLAHVIQHSWEALGIPSQKHAMDLAYRLDVLSETIERTATENESLGYDATKIAAARAERKAAAEKQAEATVGEGTIKDDDGAMLRGGAPEQDNMTKEVQGPHDYDESDIGKLKPPEQADADEPYMDAFTQDEFHQLADIQQSGEFSNAKAALKQAGVALAQAAAAL